MNLNTKFTWKKVVYPVCAFFIVLCIWELSSRIFIEQMFVLPPPTSILSRIINRWDRFLFHTFITLKEMLVGFALASLVAFPVAWMMYAWSAARLVLQPFFVCIQCIPMFVLAPIMVMWFGWGQVAIVIPAALMIFFPLTINIFQGLASTPKSLMEYFEINQATHSQRFFKLQLPWALPHIFSGVKISAAIAGIGAIGGEWAGAQSGLGVLMLESRRDTDLATTFGALFFLTFISLSFYVLILLLERFILRYKSMSSKTFVTAFAFLSFILGGCQSSTDSSTRFLLDWLPNPNHVPIYVGIEKGFFANVGIDLHIQKIANPGDAVPYLSSGRAELALSYMPATVRAIERGANIEPVGVLFKQPLNGLIYLRDEAIKTPADLSGKVVGYCVDGAETKALDYVLEKNNIIPLEKKNVSFDLVSTLGTKKVDVIYGAYWNIECEHLESMGIKTDYFDLRDLSYLNYYELIVIAKANSAQTQPAYVDAFKKALQKSIEYSKDYPEEAFAIYLKSNPDKSEETVAWERNSWDRTYPILAKDQDFDEKMWKHFKKWVIRNRFY